ncbi:hypothetical protein B0H13DRAFT_1890077 [Mycena leptocephala]|nr:hypothetical protein B0H13DRAFT_1890077 [Mycena leptocephala]
MNINLGLPLSSSVLLPRPVLAPSLVLDTHKVPGRVYLATTSSNPDSRSARPIQVHFNNFNLELNYSGLKLDGPRTRLITPQVMLDYHTILLIYILKTSFIRPILWHDNPKVVSPDGNIFSFRDTVDFKFTSGVESAQVQRLPSTYFRRRVSKIPRCGNGGLKSANDKYRGRSLTRERTQASQKRELSDEPVQEQMGHFHGAKVDDKAYEAVLCVVNVFGRRPNQFLQSDHSAFRLAFFLHLLPAFSFV